MKEMYILECTLVRPTGFRIIEISENEDIIAKLKKEAKGRPFVLNYVPKNLLEKMKNNQSISGEGFDKLLRERDRNKCPILGYAGNNLEKEPERATKISSENPNNKGTFVISEDGSTITFVPYVRFDKERDAYKYRGADFFTDINMQDLIQPIMQNARKFLIYDYYKGVPMPISQKQMVDILNNLINKDREEENDDKELR